MGLPQPVSSACLEIHEEKKLTSHILARRALVAMAEFYESMKFQNAQGLLDESRACASCLAKSRPAASIVANVMSDLYIELVSACSKSETPQETAQQVVSVSLGELERSFIETSREVGRAVGPEKILLATSCTQSLIEGISRGRAQAIIVAESRPGYEGRYAAAQLAEAGLAVELVSDAVAPALVRNVTEVLVGASVILADGATAGRTGILGVGLAAAESGIPLHVVGEGLKISPIHATPQERRPGEELWPNAPHKVEVLNPTYDLLPASLITSIITERGKISADDTAQIAARKRPAWRALGLC